MAESVGPVVRQVHDIDLVQLSTKNILTKVWQYLHFLFGTSTLQPGCFCHTRVTFVDWSQTLSAHYQHPVMCCQPALSTALPSCVCVCVCVGGVIVCGEETVGWLKSWKMSPCSGSLSVWGLRLPEKKLHKEVKEVLTRRHRSFPVFVFFLPIPCFVLSTSQKSLAVHYRYKQQEHAATQTRVFCFLLFPFRYSFLCLF